MEYLLRLWTNEDLDSIIKNATNKKIINFMPDGFPKNIDEWRS